MWISGRFKIALCLALATICSVQKTVCAFLKRTLWETFMWNYFRFGPVAQEISFKEKDTDDEQLTTYSTNDSTPETITILSNEPNLQKMIKSVTNVQTRIASHDMFFVI